MSRQLKRVPLDFSWPIGKVWEGFLNKYSDMSIECPHCAGRGDSPAAKRLTDQWYGYAPFRPEDRGSVPFEVTHPTIVALAERNIGEWTFAREDALKAEALRLCCHFNSSWLHHINQDDVNALVKKGRLTDFTHVWSDEDRKWVPREDGYVPTAQEVNDWSLRGMGHDSINQWVVIKAECDRLGLDTACKECSGHGHTWPTAEFERMYNEWTPTQPPEGEGYQLWEDVTEGSPVSPVFTSLEDLCRWCADNATTFASYRATYDEWLKMLREDFVHHTEGNVILM